MAKRAASHWVMYSLGSKQIALSTDILYAIPNTHLTVEVLTSKCARCVTYLRLFKTPSLPYLGSRAEVHTYCASGRQLCGARLKAQEAKTLFSLSPTSRSSLSPSGSVRPARREAVGGRLETRSPLVRFPPPCLHHSKVRVIPSPFPEVRIVNRVTSAAVTAPSGLARPSRCPRLVGLYLEVKVSGWESLDTLDHQTFISREVTNYKDPPSYRTVSVCPDCCQHRRKMPHTLPHSELFSK
ncbi:hypothetical protein RRG08_060620 [Elysia crispata]|uniref:Uncharacterized protein n=1 Tax=Elysia crispata TaxID=231223 RepID=A0AAE0Z406_9GAST|nr:hypothetical protein RRG08_060620 [Elysia crispata]